MTILVGDCRAVLAGMEPASVDAVVTDPPYELAFMGKRWDAAGVSFDPATWAACRRMLRPGGYLLAFGGTRTYHRIACAIEDAGFEIKDCLSWLYGSGFPKHKSLLKPAWEPVVVARLSGTGPGLRIDDCRIGTTAETWPSSRSYAPHQKQPGHVGRTQATGAVPPGRWPANVVLDEAAADQLDAEAGERRSGVFAPHHRRNAPRFAVAYRDDQETNAPAGQVFGGDSGGPSRFYYVAKASRSEREAGLAGMPERTAQSTGWSGESMPQRQDARPGRTVQARPLPAAANHHPTVKPVALMRWLVRLVCPPDGIVLDPFAGSGSTGVACAHEGLRFVGIEQDGDYAEIARRRIAHAAGPLLAEVAD